MEFHGRLEQDGQLFLQKFFTALTVNFDVPDPYS